ncbi:hypothetical protein [Corynebacterium guangdongense]|uniref:Uncharacterized protein n=1 Tax=Corynebacterium guangdongense TaxID=1783348 RepID=A0ABU1ZWB0_9CORY|nr:hypothetical protein [Corynebacterium guangdongense]MDR7329229.1 hypothetical protein [Corynebacterium guangdongense]WJZ17795.1 hypothetical protein CGUA_06100 [Corynebacterium guangdongense]
MTRLGNIASVATGGVRSSFHSRREELMRGGADTLWALTAADERVFLTNISRDIEVQEAWFTGTDGRRQALGPIRPGEHSEIRALRGRDTARTITGTVDWRVRSMLLPWVSIHRHEDVALTPTSFQTPG